uniref:RING-CH-type domain-containing protein n=1 Tax=Chenopodium quinoa TaxID=63459 RepID=A0A803KXJ1_CHEQI
MAGNADDDDAAPLIMSPPSPILPSAAIDIEAGPSEQIQCRICLETDGRDFITPCKCKGTSKYVHRECLDQWRAVKEGFAFAHCTTCKAPYYLRVHALADRKWRTLKFRFFVTRDILFIFLAVQLEYVVEDVDGELPGSDWTPPPLPPEHVQQLKSLGLL